MPGPNQPADLDPECETLARANYANHVAALNYRNRLYVEYFGRGEVYAPAGEPGLSWCRLGDGAFNVVYGAQLGDAFHSPDVRDAVAAMTRRVDDEWQEPARWFVSTLDRPARLRAVVEAAGWQYGYDWTEMGLALPTGAPSGDDTEIGIEIEIVEDDSARREWMIVQRAGYELTGALAEFIEQLSRAFVEDPAKRFRLYLARRSGEPASAAAMFVDERAAGAFMVATHPDHRRKGLARMLMRRLIDDAEAGGCASCVLQSSDSARALYGKLGFVETGATSVYRRDPGLSGGTR